MFRAFLLLVVSLAVLTAAKTTTAKADKADKASVAAALALHAKNYPPITYFNKNDAPNQLLQAIPGPAENTNSKGYFDGHNHWSGVNQPQATALGYAFHSGGGGAAEHPVKSALAANVNAFNALHSSFIKKLDGVAPMPDWALGADPLLDFAMYVAEFLTFKTVRGLPIYMIKGAAAGYKPVDETDPGVTVDETEDWAAFNTAATTALGNGVDMAAEVGKLEAIYLTIRAVNNQAMKAAIAADLASPKPSFMDNLGRISLGSMTLPAFYQAIATTDFASDDDLNNALINCLTASPLIDFDASYVASGPWKKLAKTSWYTHLALQTLMLGRVKYVEMFHSNSKVVDETARVNAVTAAWFTGPQGNQVAVAIEFMAMGVSPAFAEGGAAGTNRDINSYVSQTGNDGTVTTEALMLSSAEELVAPAAAGGQFGGSATIDKTFKKQYELITEHGARGTDFASPETYIFNENDIGGCTWEAGPKQNWDKPACGGGKGITRRWMQMGYEAAKAKTQRVVLHTHCGEGFPVWQKFGQTGFLPQFTGRQDMVDKITADFAGAKAGLNTGYMTPEKFALFKAEMIKPFESITPGFFPTYHDRHGLVGMYNVQSLTNNIAAIRAEMPDKGRDFDNMVEIRFGHLTFVSDASADKMKANNIGADLNLYSNIVTGATRFPGNAARPNMERAHEGDFSNYFKSDSANNQPHGSLVAMTKGLCACLGSDGRGIETSEHRRELQLMRAAGSAEAANALLAGCAEQIRWVHELPTTSTPGPSSCGGAPTYAFMQKKTKIQRLQQATLNPSGAGL